MTRYEKLYKYCTTARVHGSIYKKKLKELQQLTVKELRRHEKESTNNKDNCNNN